MAQSWLWGGQIAVKKKKLYLLLPKGTEYGFAILWKKNSFIGLQLKVS